MFILFKCDKYSSAFDNHLVRICGNLIDGSRTRQKEIFRTFIMTWHILFTRYWYDIMFILRNCDRQSANYSFYLNQIRSSSWHIRLTSTCASTCWMVYEHALDNNMYSWSLIEFAMSFKSAMSAWWWLSPATTSLFRPHQPIARWAWYALGKRTGKFIPIM